MLPLKLLAPLVAIGVATPAPPAVPAHSLYASRELWATVDVCSPRDRPNTIGIRGSMPSDGHPGDTMFMRFRVQYFEASTRRWADVAKGANSSYEPVRGAPGGSQLGVNFQLVPSSGPFRLRGVVDFQWRQGARVVHEATRLTTAGHMSLVGADPAGFSAASCRIG
jgi:hypothetical protein